MSVSSEISQVQYVANGVTKIFTVTYNFADPTWLVVELFNTTTGLYTTLIYNTDYTVTGGTSGGTVTTTVAPALGNNVIISRTNIPIVQEEVFTENDPFPAQSIEYGLDYLTYLIQQAQRLNGNNDIHFPDGDNTNGTLLPIILRKNRLFYFDNNGALTYSPNNLPNTYLTLDGSGIPSWQPIITGSPGETFLQAGIGAVPRNFQDKTREMFSVKDFGALGNGSTNDTIAVQTAITAASLAGGNIVYFPPGTYLLDQVTLNANNIYAGAGDATQLVLESTSAGLSIFLIDSGSSSLTIDNILIRDMYFNAAAIGNNIQAQGVKNFFVQNCYFNVGTSYSGVLINTTVTEQHNYNVNILNGVYNGLSTGVQILDCDKAIVLNNQFNNTTCLVATTETYSVVRDIKVSKSSYYSVSGSALILSLNAVTTTPAQNITFNDNEFEDCTFAFEIDSITNTITYDQNIVINNNNITDSGIMTCNSDPTFFINGLKFYDNNCNGNIGQLIFGNNNNCNFSLVEIYKNKFNFTAGISTDNCIQLNGIASYIFIENNKFNNYNSSVNVVTGSTIQGNSCKYYGNDASTCITDHNYPAWYTDDPGSIFDAFTQSTLPNAFILNGIARAIVSNGGFPATIITDVTFNNQGIALGVVQNLYVYSGAQKFAQVRIGAGTFWTDGTNYAILTP